MKRGPQPGKSPVDFLSKARAAWGATLPDEIAALAEACALRSASAVAKELGYSPAVISNTIANKYPGDVAQVRARIRGALMGETVDCPVLGAIGRDACLRSQKLPFSTSNPTRARLHRACAACPNRRSQMEAPHV